MDITTEIAFSSTGSAQEPDDAGQAWALDFSSNLLVTLSKSVSSGKSEKTADNRAKYEVHSLLEECE